MAKHSAYPAHEGVYASLGVDDATSDASTPTAAPKKSVHIAPYLVIVGLLCAVYLGGVALFSTVFYPHTTLDGQDVSFKLVGEVAQAHSESTGMTKLVVRAGDTFSGEVVGADVDLTLQGDAYAHKALSTQNAWLWPGEFWRQHALSFPEKASFDADKLHETVTTMIDDYNKTAVKPTNATARYNDESDSYELVPAQAGTTLIEEKVESSIASALEMQQATLDLGEDCYEQPAVADDDEKLHTAIDEVNKKLSATQSLTIEDHEVAQVSSDQIGSWVKLADDLSITVDDDAITKWARGELSEKLDTAGSTRHYTLPDGTSLTVSGGTYGWIIDGAALAKQIASNIRDGASGSIEVPMKQKAAVHADGGADWGTRWIDIDLSDQHVALYDEGKTVWESNCVTGNITEGYGTPTGVYAINSNMTSIDQTGKQVKLVSPFKDKHGKPTYTSYVDYWMPFIDNQYAFHDASWRSSSEFGGSTYKTDGSHGCVNLPADKAKELYSLVSVGDVVVVHD